MVEIITISRYSWRDPDERVRPKTQVTWRDAKGAVHVTVLDGDLWDLEKIVRKVRLA